MKKSLIVGLFVALLLVGAVAAAPGFMPVEKPGPFYSGMNRAVAVVRDRFGDVREDLKFMGGGAKYFTGRRNHVIGISNPAEHGTDYWWCKFSAVIYPSGGVGCEMPPLPPFNHIFY